MLGISDTIHDVKHFRVGLGVFAFAVFLIGCGGAGGGSGSGNNGTDSGTDGTTDGGQGTITRAFDGSWSGTFDAIGLPGQDHGTISFTVDQGHATGTVSIKNTDDDHPIPPRFDRAFTATTYTNGLISTDVASVGDLTPVIGPGMRFKIRIQYATFGTFEANVIAHQ